MNEKLMAFGLVVATLLAVAQPLRAHMRVHPSMEDAAVILVPSALDGFDKGSQWNHVLQGTTVEQGALYSPLAGGSEVQLDFYRNSASPHNGAGCYLSQGERLRSQQMMMLPTQTGAESFLVTFMTDGHQLRLVASTECRAEGCSEEKVHTGFRLDVFSGLFQERSAGVVPVSIVLRRPYDSRDDLATHEAALLTQARQFLQQLDLSTARQLASQQRAGS
jgi:hypothetical protein